MKKDNFQTQYREPKRVHSNVGSRVKKTYGPVFRENGSFYLEEKGEEDTYAFIQSFKDSVDINVIMKRYVNGEVDVLSKVQGFYGDVTGMPQNFAQTLNLVNDGRTLFESLPVETRSLFNHNFNEFMSAVVDGSLMDRLGVNPDPSPSPSDPSPSPSGE